MDNLRELELDEIMQWPLPAQMIVVALLALLLSVGGYFYFVKPELSELDSLKEKEAQLHNELTLKSNQVAAIPYLEEQIEMLQARYERVLTQLPAEQELASLVSGINEIGVEFGLAFHRIDWANRVRRDDYEEIPLSLSISGDYNQVGDFSAAIASMPRLVSLHDFSLGRGNDGLRLQVSAKTYRFLSEVERGN
ncbi:type 4a pilus biogenesis protein PilO [Thaumasiovibrio subtropicus]|uniref:type 4a pilus biogenesis protein PilO n=1 Tax=Thaumasiovibrio subtropicus TaxID=1891207 RepID=UPI000B35A3D9|nr:type 4a pilus biogenesis protein PilO [Thaumasiovibrio subtropicus]